MHTLTADFPFANAKRYCVFSSSAFVWAAASLSSISFEAGMPALGGVMALNTGVFGSNATGALRLARPASIPMSARYLEIPPAP